ncbi:MAG: HAD family hydrolase [Acidimicrobiales bacterium]
MRVRVPPRAPQHYGLRPIETWLTLHDLRHQVTHVEGRQVRLMKPHPHSLNECARILDVDVGRCVFVGDSVTDAEAANAIDMPFVALANKPSKVELFDYSGCRWIIASMSELVARARS